MQVKVLPDVICLSPKITTWEHLGQGPKESIWTAMNAIFCLSIPIRLLELAACGERLSKNPREGLDQLRVEEVRKLYYRN